MSKKKSLSDNFRDIFFDSPLKIGASAILTVAFMSQATNLAYDESERHKIFLEQNGFSDVTVEDRNYVWGKALTCGIGSDFSYSEYDGIRKEGLICNGIAWNNDEITIHLDNNSL